MIWEFARQLGAQGQASHQEGSFPSVLKTVEDMFGLRALTIYDRGARALHDVVVDKLADANASRYTAVQPPTPFLRNPPLSEADAGTAQLEQMSLKANFWSLDQGNPVLEHDVLYAGLRGDAAPHRRPRTDRALVAGCIDDDVARVSLAGDQPSTAWPAIDSACSSGARLTSAGSESPRSCSRSLPVTPPCEADRSVMRAGRVIAFLARDGRRSRSVPESRRPRRAITMTASTFTAAIDAIT